MPVVVFRFAPRKFVLPVRPYRRWVDALDVVHSPVATLVASRNGVAEVIMPPTDPSFCYEVMEPGGITRFVTVPDVPGPIEYADLPTVDPATLDPAAEPEAAWWAALNALAALVGGGVGGQTLHQTEPASIWTFSHLLGYEPAGIRVVDDDGTVQIPSSVDYLGPSTIALQFARPLSGTVRLS